MHEISGKAVRYGHGKAGGRAGADEVKMMRFAPQLVFTGFHGILDFGYDIAGSGAAFAPQNASGGDVNRALAAAG